MRRAFREDEFSTRTSSDSKSLNRDKLIALFRRIQIEISGEESGTGKYSESSQASIDDDSSVETSVLEYLQQSNKESKGEVLVISASFSLPDFSYCMITG